MYIVYCAASTPWGKVWSGMGLQISGEAGGDHPCETSIFVHMTELGFHCYTRAFGRPEKVGVLMFEHRRD
jgi:hypothetical protein